MRNVIKLGLVCSLLLISILVIADQSQIGKELSCIETLELTTHEIMELALEKQKRSFGSLGFNFNSFTSKDTEGYPPDVEGALGTEQYIAIMNGWIRSFKMENGRADNIININLQEFFAPIARNQDPFDTRIRFDRLSNRWFMLCINGGSANFMYIAVSQGPVINDYSKWKFYKFQIGTAGVFADYPTLGIDANALYVGTNNFNVPTQPGELNSTLFVLPKAPFIAATTPTIFSFSAGASGVQVPQGVNNFDPAATTGYFIGSNRVGQSLVVWRVSTPGAVPTISAPITVSGVPPFIAPPTNVRSKDGRLIDGGDLRLLCAHIRNNRLWTVHNIGTDNAGNSTVPANVTRSSVRWYEIDIVPGTPVVVQQGTLFDSAVSNPISYIYPAVMTSGQNNMVLACSTTGQNAFLNATLACRLSTDPAGTLQTPMNYTDSDSAYNFEADTPTANRWGDYFYVALDPNNDMTMWAVAQWCNQKDGWACRVVQVKAPPPAEPISATDVASEQASVITTVTGMSASGSGFYDPGVGFPQRIRATVNGGIVVNSITYISPTVVLLDLNTTGITPGTYNITIINPDGQSAIGSGILTVI